MTEIKKVFHQIENRRKNLENETWLNLKILRIPVINVEKNIKRDIRTVAKPQVRLTTTVINHVSIVWRSKRNQVSKINKTENLEAKISANKGNESDSAQEAFTLSPSGNYANEIPNQ